MRRTCYPLNTYISPWSCIDIVDQTHGLIDPDGARLEAIQINKSLLQPLTDRVKHSAISTSLELYCRWVKPFMVEEDIEMASFTQCFTNKVARKIKEIQVT